MLKAAWSQQWTVCTRRCITCTAGQLSPWHHRSQWSAGSIDKQCHCCTCAAGIAGRPCSALHSGRLLCRDTSSWRQSPRQCDSCAGAWGKRHRRVSSCRRSRKWLGWQLCACGGTASSACNTAKWYLLLWCLIRLFSVVLATAQSSCLLCRVNAKNRGLDKEMGMWVSRNTAEFGLFRCTGVAHLWGWRQGR